MKRLSLIAAIAFAIAPGIIIFWTKAGIPLGEYAVPFRSHIDWLFAGIVEVCGLLAFFILRANRAKLDSLQTSKITKAVISLALLSFVSLGLYIVLFNYCVVTHPERGTVFYPLWTSGDLAKTIKDNRGRLNAIGTGRADIEDLAQAMPVSLALTLIILLFVYQLIFTPLVCALAIVGLRKETQSQGEQEVPGAQGQPQVERESRTVKILFLASNPSDTVQLRVDREIHAIEQKLRTAEFRDFDLIPQLAIRVDDLQGALLRYMPHIVHFSGHGSESSEIILEDNAGNSHPVSTRALSNLFLTLKDNIRCVVLNACYSENQAKAIAQHIDCVVGMSDVITDEASINFAAAFYEALGYGRNIKTAFDLGCGRIGLENLSEEDTPKLLVREGDARTIYLTKRPA